jgi:uncharacterized membrane protein (DUF373 family)
VAEVAEKKEHPRGVARTIWVLEHTQDLVSIVVGVLLAGLAVVVLVLGVVDFFRDVTSGSPVETAVINLLNRVLLVLILVEIMHTVVLSLRAHHLVTQPLLAVGLVAVIRKILFVLSSEEPVSTAELALLIAMIAVFVAALILVSRYDRTDAGR